MSALLAGVITMITPMTAGCNRGGGTKQKKSVSGQASGNKSGGGKAVGGKAKAPVKKAPSAPGNNRGIPPAARASQVKTTSVKGSAALTIRASVTMKQVPATLTKIFTKVHKHLAARKIKASGEPFMYFPVLPKSASGKISFQAGYPVPRGTKGKGKIKATRRPGGKVAFLSYSGSSKAAAKAHRDIAIWMREKKVTPAGGAWEVYRNVNVGKPSRSVSATVYYPVK